MLDVEVAQGRFIVCFSSLNFELGCDDEIYTKDKSLVRGGGRTGIAQDRQT
jgi:hypothetical protein